jgi:hypothetical protein
MLIKLYFSKIFIFIGLINIQSNFILKIRVALTKCIKHQVARKGALQIMFITGLKVNRSTHQNEHCDIDGSTGQLKEHGHQDWVLFLKG